MAIKIKTTPTQHNLVGKSHWWGFPDLPEGVAYPCASPQNQDGSEDTLTFVCQIRLEEIAPFDSENMLPHTGMLYFFASLDYFLGDIDAPCAGLGVWKENMFRVIYAPDIDQLHTHEVYWEDHTPACLPAEAMEFSLCPDKEAGQKLLGRPYYDEVEEACDGMLSLLQIDEEERWGLRFMDCGNLHLLIDKHHLVARSFNKTIAYCHSF